MSKLEEVKQKICELIPEIKELKLGCVVQVINNQSISKWKFIGQTDYHTKPIWENVWSNFATVRWSDQVSDKEFEILGRDIRLADVLIALSFEAHIECFPQNDNRLLIQNFSEPKTAGWYNLLKDRIDDQSPECIDFIHSLICN